MLDSIHLEGELYTLCLIAGFPVTQTHGCKFAIRNCFRQVTGTRVSLIAIEMERMTATTTGRTFVHRSHHTEIIKHIRVLIRRRVIHITNRIIEIQIVHTEFIGIIDKNGLNRFETIEIIIAFSTHHEVRLSDRQRGEMISRIRHDVWTEPCSCTIIGIIAICADLIFSGGAFPRQIHGFAIGSNDQIGRRITRRNIRYIDVINHCTRLLSRVSTVTPSESKVVGRTVTLITRKISHALMPCRSTAEALHIRHIRLEVNHLDIILVIG